MGVRKAPAGWRRRSSRLLKKRIFSSARYCIDDDVRIAV
jgi:hypothetical protein